MTDTREEQILRTFSQVANTLVDGYEIVEMLQNLVDSSCDLLDMDEAGILLTASGSDLDLVVSTSENDGLVELLLRAGQAGPAQESVRTAMIVSVPDIASSESWGLFARDATALGFGAVHSVPLRLRDSAIGTLSLLSREAGELDATATIAAQALADVATIGILHERALRESTIVVEQLQNALKSRVVIEQAKGVLSQTLGISIDEAFDVIRRYARSHRAGLSSTAEQIVARTLNLPRDGS